MARVVYLHRMGIRIYVEKVVACWIVCGVYNGGVIIQLTVW